MTLRQRLFALPLPLLVPMGPGQPPLAGATECLVYRVFESLPCPWKGHPSSPGSGGERSPRLPSVEWGRRLTFLLYDQKIEQSASAGCLV